jgi:serine/threonine protein kinase/Tfp pilus assembly protein PilF
MKTEQWLQVERIYHEALEREPAARASFLDEVCAGDQQLHAEVAELLAHDEAEGSFLKAPALEIAARALAKETPQKFQSEEKPLPAAAPSRIGSYKLLHLLGRGGMGEVHLAFDERLGRKAAIKLLPVEFTANSERVRRFEHEARAASALNHPNIITIHEIGETESEAGSARYRYIVVEYIEGETLRQLLTASPSKRIALSEAVEIATQIAAALAAAHEAGIAHRDIKPENVMRRRDGLVKVLDFGLARFSASAKGSWKQGGGEGDSTADPFLSSTLTETGMVIGTPRYMSPEQARGEKVDSRTDVFSLGVILYEMIAGHAPFKGESTSEVIAAILRDEPPALGAQFAETPPEIEQIVNRALRKDRAERYQTAGAMRDDLQRLKERLLVETFAAPASGAGFRAHPLSPDERRVNTRLRYGLIALAIAVLGLAAVWAYFSPAAPPPESDTVLVAEFENRTGDKVFDGTLKLGLATQLEQPGALRVFPEARVRQTLQQMDRPADTPVTTELAQEICERQNLKAFVVGSIAALGGRYVITLVASAGRGDEQARAQAEAAGKEQALDALARATAQLHSRLVGRLKSIERNDKPLEQGLTANLEALKTFSAGRELLIAGRPLEALPLMRRAVELDPKFSLAYDQLALISWVSEQPEAASEYQSKILQLQAERSARSKPAVNEAAHHNADIWKHRLITGDLSKSLENVRIHQRMNPGNPLAENELGLALLLIGQSEQALPPLREVIRLSPKFNAPYKFMAQALVRLDRFGEAKDVLSQALRLKIESTLYHSLLYQIAFIEGDASEMQRQLDWTQGQSEEYIASNWQSGGAAYAGRRRAAQEFSRRAAALAAQRNNREVAARFAVEQALRNAAIGDCRPAESNAIEGLSYSRGRLPLSRAALSFAWCGNANQAKRLTDELLKLAPEDTLIKEVWLPMIRAAQSLRRGAKNDMAALALDQLQPTLRYEHVAEFWPQYLRGQAYLKLKQGEEAATEFQKILDHRGYAPLSPLYPLAHLGLARAAALTGAAAKSRKAYEDFFAAWERADTDLPILIEAKREFLRQK